MLRITEISHTRTSATLKLEGRICAQWVSVLEDECRRRLATGRSVRLDCADVHSIDSSGITMLRGLPKGRVEFLNSEPFIEALLREKSS